MTDNNGWEKCGDLWLKVSPYDRNDPEHRDAALQVMYNSVRTVAQKHGAQINEKGLRYNERAISSGDLWVDLYLAKWEACERKTTCLGGALGWESYGFTPEGQLVRSFYTEEISLPRKQLRKLIEAWPDGKKLPEESLAECFERISLNQMRADGIFYRYGELDPDNLTMRRQLSGNDTDIGGPNSAVLEYKRIPIDFTATWHAPVVVVPIIRGGVCDEKNFYVQTEEGGHDIRFLVTKGHATTIGQPRADIRPWHKGNLPDQKTLENIIASSLTHIKQEIDDEREWGKEKTPYFPSPIMPASAPQSEINRALYDAAGNEVGINAAHHRLITIHKPISDAHVYVQNDERMLDGFLAKDAKQRWFGGRPMKPAVNVIRRELRPAA